MLSPGDVEQFLTTRYIGTKLVLLPTAGSTNDIARQLAAGGTPEGTVVVAEQQTAGRGRRGRTWVSPPGCLYLSVVLRPRLHPSNAFYLTMLAAIAVLDGVYGEAGLTCQVKWPNDILVGGKKLAGILTETSTTGDSLDFAVVGIGLNVNLDATAFPEIARTATSLSGELGRDVSRAPVLASVLGQMERWYDELRAGNTALIYRHWRDSLAYIGQLVMVAHESGSWEGIAEDADADGTLILRQADGRVRRVTVGDVMAI